ncbi:glycoside hydrolase domain-containing protein [Sulfitobacter geojensis]|uniref:glycoside hydrolase domain-containing protein n=1 Tax=Sulfitobacter geojensis TaxID=1342299 RepID=UPI00046935F9|nr:glycoside hydrolase domain-containing protein [Sulfitobacter geojensis]KHA51861.1 DUF1906 protein [Sulfitobacter geojensis]NYI29269.1 hypothetical protein [Sulfitobacter geojensis]
MSLNHNAAFQGGQMLIRLLYSTFVFISLATMSVAGPACKAHPGFSVIDASHPLTDIMPRDGRPAMAAIRDLGVETIIRYYDNVAETLPCKTLVPEETRAILQAGFSVLAVFQHNNDNPMTFVTPGRGTLDAQRAIELALANGQPSGSAIYFGVDGVDGAIQSANYEFAKSGGNEISQARQATLQSSMGAGSFRKHQAFYDIYREEAVTLFGGTAGKHGPRDILPYIDTYFRDIQTIFTNFGNQTGIRYEIGGYGGGLVCEHLLSSGMVEYCWLSQSKGLAGYETFEASQKWVMRQELTTVCNGWKFGTGGDFQFDFNTVNPRTPDFGQWNTQVDYAVPFSRPLKRDGAGCYAWRD